MSAVHSGAAGVVVRSAYFKRTGILPVCKSIVRIQPVGDLQVHVDQLTGPEGVIPRNLLGYRRIAGILDALPRTVGVENLSLPLSKKNESGAYGGVRHRLVPAFAPDLGRDHVPAGFHVYGDVQRLVVPVLRVVPCRSERDKSSVDIELIALVGRHMDHERPGRIRQFDILAEIIDPVFFGIRTGDFNPRRTPFVL